MSNVSRRGDLFGNVFLRETVTLPVTAELKGGTSPR